jgi:hypothetical protein
VLTLCLVQFERYNRILRERQPNPKYKTTILMLISGIMKMRKRTILDGDRRAYRGLSVRDPEELVST